MPVGGWVAASVGSSPSCPPAGPVAALPGGAGKERAAGAACPLLASLPPAAALPLQAEPDLPRLVSTGSHKLTPRGSSLQPQQQQSQGSMAPAASDGTAAAAVAAAASAAAVEDGPDAGAGAAAAPKAAAQLASLPSASEAAEWGLNATSSSNSGSGVKQQAAAAVEHSLSLRELSSSLYGYRTDLAALVLLALCTAALGVGVGLERDHKWLRTNWLACLLGPLG